MNLLDVIIQQYLTEKTEISKNICGQKKYAFLVDKRADKNMIKLAIQTLFAVIPEKVSTMNRKSVQIKTGTKYSGYSRAVKIAYVTLKKGETIPALEQQLDQNPISSDSNETVVEAKSSKKDKTSVEEKNESTEVKVSKKGK